jgi:hypothetical protein
VIDVNPLRTGAADDERPDRPARWDHEVARDNMRAWERKRGRVCAYPDCDTKVRYSRPRPFCSLHELTPVAQQIGKPGPIPGANVAPKTPGLRAIRKAKKIPTKELAPLVGRSVIWLQRAERGAHGVPDEVRAKLCEVLGVSEAELFAGEFKRKGE